MFQHTAARRRLDKSASQHQKFKKFQHTAARRRLVEEDPARPLNTLVSTHSRPKAAGPRHRHVSALPHVSTHSRPKAAGQPKIRERPRC